MLTLDTDDLPKAHAQLLRQKDIELEQKKEELKEVQHKLFVTSEHLRGQYSMLGRKNSEVRASRQRLEAKDAELEWLRKQLGRAEKEVKAGLGRKNHIYWLEQELKGKASKLQAAANSLALKEKELEAAVESIAAKDQELQSLAATDTECLREQLRQSEEKLTEESLRKVDALALLQREHDDFKKKMEEELRSKDFHIELVEARMKRKITMLQDEHAHKKLAYEEEMDNKCRDSVANACQAITQALMSEVHQSSERLSAILASLLSQDADLPSGVPAAPLVPNTERGWTTPFETMRGRLVDMERLAQAAVEKINVKVSKNMLGAVASKAANGLQHTARAVLGVSCNAVRSVLRPAKHDQVNNQPQESASTPVNKGSNPGHKKSSGSLPLHPHAAKPASREAANRHLHALAAARTAVTVLVDVTKTVVDEQHFIPAGSHISAQSLAMSTPYSSSPANIAFQFDKVQSNGGSTPRLFGAPC